MSSNKKPTQCDLILEYMQRFGSITTFEAFEEIGCTRLPSRICELKEDHNIIVEIMQKRSRTGRIISYARYSLKE